MKTTSVLGKLCTATMQSILLVVCLLLSKGSALVHTMCDRASRALENSLLK